MGAGGGARRKDEPDSGPVTSVMTGGRRAYDPYKGTIRLICFLLALIGSGLLAWGAFVFLKTTDASDKNIQQDGRIDGLYQKVDGVEKKVDQMDGKLDKVLIELRR